MGWVEDVRSGYVGNTLSEANMQDVRLVHVFHVADVARSIEDKVFYVLCCVMARCISVVILHIPPIPTPNSVFLLTTLTVSRRRRAMTEPCNP